MRSNADMLDDRPYKITKKRRVVGHKEPLDDDTLKFDVEAAIEMRERSISLYQGLQNHWICVCHKCSGLSLRLSVPQQEMSSQGETCFDVIFCMQDPSKRYSSQEAKITVK